MSGSAPSSTSQVARAARGGVLNLAGAAVSALASFGLAMAVTRGTTPALAGVFFTATSLFLLATTVGQLGTNAGLVYSISRARGQGSLRNIGVYMRTALGPVLIAGVLMGAALWFWAEPSAAVMSRTTASPALTSAIRWMAPFVPAAALLNVSLSGTRGLGTMRINALVDQLLRSGGQVLLVLAALLLAAPTLVPVAWALPYLPLGVVAWAAWRRLSRRARAGELPDADYRPARAFWGFSLPRGLAGIAQVSMQRLDVILVGALAGLVPAAVYAAASRFLSLGLLANGAISQAVQPLLGESLGRNDRDTTADLYRTTTGWLVIGAWPIYLTLVAFPEEVLRVFGAEYTSGRSALVILAAAMLVGTGCGMVSMVVTMAGKTTWNLANVLVALVVMLGLDLWLIPRLGITGAAIGWASAILAANLLPLAQVYALFRLQPFGRGTLTAMSCAVLATGLLPFAITRGIGTGPVQLGTAVALGALTYAVLLFATRRVTRLPELVASVRRRRAGGGAVSAAAPLEEPPAPR